MANTYTINNNDTLSNITIANGGFASTTGSTYTLNTGAGANGSWLTSTGTATAWATPTTNFNDGTTPVMTIPHNSKTIEIDKAATLDVKGNVKINGIDLEERLRTIEKVLMIPERDVNMEAKYPSLKKKYDEYIDALGKYRTFEAIKGKDE